MDLTTGVLIAAVLYILTQNQGNSLRLIQFDYDRLIMNWHSAPDFFIYLFLCRCLPFYLLMILTFRLRKKFLCHLYFLYVGFVYGTEGLLSTFEYGSSGLFICFFRMMPQVLFYAAALWSTWQLSKDKGSHFPTKDSRLFMAAFLLWTVGAALEGILNPYLLQFGIRLLL